MFSGKEGLQWSLTNGEIINVKGRKHIPHCIFMQLNMLENNKLGIGGDVMITCEAWGNGLLDNNCIKIGAKDENS